MKASPRIMTWSRRVRANGIVGEMSGFTVVVELGDIVRAKANFRPDRDRVLDFTRCSSGRRASSTTLEFFSKTADLEKGR